MSTSFDGNILKDPSSVAPISAGDVIAAGGQIQGTLANWFNLLEINGTALGSNATGYSQVASAANYTTAALWQCGIFSDVVGTSSQTWLECKFDGTNWIRLGSVISLTALAAQFVGNNGGPPPGDLRWRHQNGAGAQGEFLASFEPRFGASGEQAGELATLTSSALNNGVTFTSNWIDLGYTYRGQAATVWVAADRGCSVWLDFRKNSSGNICRRGNRAAYSATGTVQAVLNTAIPPLGCTQLRVNILNNSGSNMTSLLAKIGHRGFLI